VKSLSEGLPERIAVIEDAAHALGSRYPDGSMVGSSGNLVCFSFYGNKNLAIGEGGAVATSNKVLLELIRKLSNQGLSEDAWARNTKAGVEFIPEVGSLGYKMNFSDLSASVGIPQLLKQPGFQQRRQSLAVRYLNNLKTSNFVGVFQKGLGSGTHSHHLFVIGIDDSYRRYSNLAVISELRSKGIGATLHYLPLHHRKLYCKYAKEKLSNVDNLSSKILTLPIGPVITESEVDEVCENLLTLFSRG